MRANTTTNINNILFSMIASWCFSAPQAESSTTVDVATGENQFLRVFRFDEPRFAQATKNYEKSP